MALKKGDELISMDILPSQVVNEIAAAAEEDVAENDGEETPVTAGNGPWVLVVTTGGLGKRVPVNQFRLQNRAGMGVMATKFRKKGDRIAALRVVNDDDEMMIVTSRGIIIRQAVNAISHQSRMATGVKVQRLDDDDAIFAVALVPPGDGEDELGDSGEEV
jgi:DNA gyrase subunit A